MTAIGQSLRRLEDPRLLAGRGRFLADEAVPGLLHAAFVRSPWAHARIVRLATGPALAVPGVVAAFVGADLKAGGVGTLPCNVPVTSYDGRPMVQPPRPVLPETRAVYVGEPLAVVIAATASAARDGAEAVDLELDELPVTVGVDSGGPDIWPEAPGNRAFELRWGSLDAVAAAFQRAARRVAITVRIPRLVPSPLETRGILALPDGRGGLVLRVPNQSPHRLRKTLAEAVLPVPEHRLDVVATDFGGGFGGRLALAPEEVAVAFAALALGRPVRWLAERSEGFLTDSHARDVLAEAELGLDADGGFVALRTTARINQGAYLSQAGPVCAYEYGVSIGSVYDFGAVDARAIGCFTNTAPTDVYRGVGRAEAVTVVERLVDAAARATGIDRADLRRRNMVGPITTPTANGVGAVYDSGDFKAALEDAMARADVAAFGARRAAAKTKGLLRGLGMAAYIHPTAGGGYEIEQARLRVHPTGTATLFVGTHSHGQGHATVYAQLVAGRLGLPIEAIEIAFGDTGRDPWGRGTYGSRSLSVAGPAMLAAADKVIAKGRRIAAHLLEASVEDIVFADGAFTVEGTDRAVSFAQVAL
ncbi:MAG: xanthine dehydrogenase family protein molybdopterin-binding subunit, partial [Alphaproteobacteria bacterium]